jgi:hypothetical protein
MALWCNRVARSGSGRRFPGAPPYEVVLRARCQGSVAGLDATGKTLEEPAKRKSAYGAHTRLTPEDESGTGKRTNGPL